MNWILSDGSESGKTEQTKKVQMCFYGRTAQKPGLKEQDRTGLEFGQREGEAYIFFFQLLRNRGRA